jgi:hypothetical protein
MYTVKVFCGRERVGRLKKTRFEETAVAVDGTE